MWNTFCLTIWSFYLFTFSLPTEVYPHNPSIITSTVFQFPNNGSWAENLQVRQTGDILITRLDVPELWSINPRNGHAELVHSFPNATGLSGITEIAPDMYAVAAGSLELSTLSSIPGTWSIWRTDLRKPKSPVFSPIGPIPEAQVLNGITTFNKELILMADNIEGVIYRFNTVNGLHSVALSDSTMQRASGSFPIGVNGVKVRDEYVYYTSTTQEKFCRVAVGMNASAKGPYEVLASGFWQDDFTFGIDGSAFIATNGQNSVVYVSPQGNVTTIAGSLTSSTLAGSTACAWGRTQSESATLYVATNRAWSDPINSTFMEPGKVVAITWE